MKKVSESDRSFIMNTAMLECSIQENIPMEDLMTRPSVRNDESWVIIQKSTKLVVFRKSFKR